MKRIVKLFAAIAGLALLVFWLLEAVDLACFDRNFYTQEYEKYQNAAVIGISDEDLMKATEVLLDYLQDQRSDMVVRAQINGIDREVFNERETAHMVDVKALYLNAMKVKNFCLALAVLIAGGILLLYKKEALVLLCGGYQKGCAVLAVLLGAIGFYAYVDFTRFWTFFHELFFTNDLWLLNPKTDIMIMMVPEGFFYDLVFKIVILFFAAAAVLYGITVFIRRRKELFQ